MACGTGSCDGSSAPPGTGDIGARLMIDPALRDDPYPYYEQLRRRGRTC